MDNDINLILRGDLDLYDFLDIPPDASDRQIRSQYRRKALIYHPDKESGDLDKFNLLSKAYEILIDKDLRKEYNEIRRIKKQKNVELEKLHASTKRFQEELKEAEKQHRFNNQDRTQELNNFVKKRVWATDLEKLKEDGLKRRRRHESLIQEKKTSETKLPQKVFISYNELPSPKAYITSLEPPLAQLEQASLPISGPLLVRWKHKSELKSLFTADVLEQIMQQFGPLKSVKLLPEPEKKPRYDTGIIVYQNAEDSQKALSHNYKASANLWDGTSVRKLASLLRECSSVSQQEVREGLGNRFAQTFTGIVAVDNVLNKFVQRNSTLQGSRQ